MLRRTSDLPRTLGRWVFQVTASVGATLIATLLYAALPKTTVPPVQPAPELTSGGKFAARAIAAAPRAFDGLDTMPLPRIDAAVLPVAFLPAPAAPSHALSAASASASLSPAPERVARPARPPRLAPPRVEARHLPAAPSAPQRAPSAPAEAAVDEASNDGWMPKVISTAHAAWSVTASAGDAVLARVVPQIP